MAGTRPKHRWGPALRLSQYLLNFTPIHFHHQLMGGGEEGDKRWEDVDNKLSYSASDEVTLWGLREGDDRLRLQFLLKLSFDTPPTIFAITSTFPPTYGSK